MLNTHSRNPLFKFAVLSISLVAMIAPAVATTIPAIMAALPDLSPSSIGLLMSVPSLAILLFVFLAPFVIKILGNKKTVMLGLIITLVCGILPFFTENFTVILASRFGLGCGIGLFNSLAYSLIMINFEGDERNQMLGFQGAFSSVGSMFGSLAVGWLLNLNWHASFMIYLIALIPIIAFGTFGPKDKVVDEVEKVNLPKEKAIIQPVVYFYALEIFFIFATWMTIVFQLATLYMERGIGTASQASFVLALNTLAGFLAGLIYGKIRSVLGNYTGIIALIFGGLILVGLGTVTSFLATVFLAITAGFLFSFINPFIFGEVAAVSSPASQNTASTILLIGINLGVFLNPYLIAFIGKVTGSTAINVSMLVCGGLLLVLGLINVLVIKSKKGKGSVKYDY
ncbi:MFS transporter [Marinilactibacillus psychrotolerans]|uniref:MFS transporter n=1 Tax=Marinilactibacillus psychrotolerans TaxID=191770 RepID=UPI0039B0E5ED